MFTNSRLDGLKYTSNKPLTYEMSEMLIHIMTVYGFIMPIGKYTTQEFIKQIKVVYSVENPYNAYVVDFLKSLPE